MSRPVYIVDYNPVWPERYDSERRRVMRVIGRRVRSIEHIGSTSVPGLGAKPIIDILAGVDDQENADLCVARAQAYTEAKAEFIRSAIELIRSK